MRTAGLVKASKYDNSKLRIIYPTEYIEFEERFNVSFYSPKDAKVRFFQNNIIFQRSNQRNGR